MGKMHLYPHGDIPHIEFSGLTKLTKTLSKLKSKLSGVSSSIQGVFNVKLRDCNGDHSRLCCVISKTQKRHSTSFSN